MFCENEINTNIWTGIRDSKYKYEYSSHTVSAQTQIYC